MRRGIVGIENIGNTCYIAAVLQCIGHCRNIVSTIFHGVEGLHGRIVSRALADIYAKKWSRESLESIDPTALVNALKSRPDSFIDYGVQNDAHEFLVELLTAVESDHVNIVVNESMSVRTGIQGLILGGREHWGRTVASKSCGLTDAVYGQHAFLTQCPVCKHVSQSFDVFVALPFVLNNNTLQAQIDADGCYVETIDGFHCDKCQNRADSRRECKISRLPKLLVVQVMRFGYGTSKDSSRITIEEHIDVSRISLSSQACKYTLVGMVCHSGSSQRGGHYYAVCKYTAKTWVVFDDTKSYSINLVAVRAEDPYLLFYELIDLDQRSSNPKTTVSSSVSSVDASSLDR